MSDDLNLEQEFKKRLEDKGILYFGPVEKHYLNDPRGRKLPHAFHQQPHGNRPGRRVLMTGLRALAAKNPHLDIPKWNDMVNMPHEQVLKIFEHHFGAVRPAKGNVIRQVDAGHAGFRRDEQAAQAGAKHLPAAGHQGDNLRVSQFPVTRMMQDKKPVEPRQELAPHTRIPGRDVADVRPHGGKDERQLGNEAGRPKGERGKGNLPRENSVVGAPRENGPATNAVAPAPVRRPAPPARLKRPAAPVVPAGGMEAGIQRARQAREAEQANLRREAAGMGANQNQTPDHKGQEAAKILVDAGVKQDARIVREIHGNNDPAVAKEHAQALRDMADVVSGPRADAIRRAADVLHPADKPAAAQPRVPVTNRPDGPGTRVARQVGVPNSAELNQKPTAAQVPHREFKQNAQDITAARQAAEAEISRNIKDGKNVNLLRIGGRLLDARAHDAVQNGRPLNEVVANRHAELALQEAKKLVQDRGGKFIQANPAKEAEWVKNLAERFHIRQQGKPVGTQQEARARQIAREEKVRTEGGGWQHAGHVRQRLKPQDNNAAPATPSPPKPKANTAQFQQAATSAQLPARNFAQNTADVAREKDMAAFGNDRQRAIADLGEKMKSWREANPGFKMNERQAKVFAQRAFDANFKQGNKDRLAAQPAKRAGEGANRAEEVVNELARIARVKQAGKLPTNAGPNTQRQAREIMRVEGPKGNRPRPDLNTAEAAPFANNPGGAPNAAAPAAGTGAIERAGVPGRLARDPAAVASLEKVLKSGTVGDRKKLNQVVEEGGQRMQVGINAADMYMGNIKQPDGKVQPVIVKRAAGQGIQEAIGWEMAKAMGINEFLPAAQVDGRNNVRMEAVGNQVAGNAGVNDYAAMQKAIENKYLGQGLSGPDAKAKAQDAAKALWLFDWVIANSDRHGGNARVQLDAKGKPVNFWLIDQGHMGGAAGRAGGRVRLYRKFGPSAGQVPGVSDSGGENRMALTPDMKQMLGGLDKAFFEQHKGLWAKAQGLYDGAKIDRIQARIDQAIKQDFINW